MNIIRPVVPVFTIGLLLVSCSSGGQATTETAGQVEPTLAVLPTDTRRPAPTAEPTATDPPPTATQPPATPTEAPTAEPTIVAEVSDHCLDCHADKDRLIATARQEEEIPSESSGPG